MRFMKKVISAICALGMIATCASSMIVAQAADKVPVLSARLEGYDSATGKGNVVLSLSNLTGLGDWDDSLTYLATVQSYMFLDPDVFDTTTDFGTNAKAKKAVTLLGAMNDGGQKGASKFGSRSDIPNTLPFSWISGDAEVTITDVNDTDIISIPIIVKDQSKLPATISFAKTKVAINVFNAARNSASLKQWNDDALGGVQGFKVGDTSIEIPANDSATANSSTILTVKPSDVGGTGDVWANEDGSEKAVAGLANFTPSAATSTIAWTISATPVGGEATEYTKEFDLGASIDAAATIGLIVNYNTAEYSSVSIVSGALK